MDQLKPPPELNFLQLNILVFQKDSTKMEANQATVYQARYEKQEPKGEVQHFSSPHCASQKRCLQFYDYQKKSKVRQTYILFSKFEL